MKHDPIAQTETVGEFIARYLAEIGVTTIFGVISIHNMPILDAVARQGRIRFVPARGEAGAMNMADAWARVSGQMGVVLTSTGTAAGNAAGAQVEALTAAIALLSAMISVVQASQTMLASSSAAGVSRDISPNVAAPPDRRCAR